MAKLRIDGIQSFLFSAAVMLGACSGSSSSGNQGGQDGGGSSTPAGTGGSAGATTLLVPCEGTDLTQTSGEAIVGTHPAALWS